MSAAVLDVAPAPVHAAGVERTNIHELECSQKACHNAAEWLVTLWCGCLPVLCNDCLKRVLLVVRRAQANELVKTWHCAPHSRTVPKQVRPIVTVRPIHGS